jgi:hypothetical protein
MRLARIQAVAEQKIAAGNENKLAQIGKQARRIFSWRWPQRDDERAICIRA